jgi:CRISPR-associated protein Cas2
MVVIILESVPKSVRGELTRWLLELRAGVFAGNISAIVRDKLWEMLCTKLKGGNAVLLHSAANEQGFLIRTHGESNYQVRDFDGLQLITIKEKRKNELTLNE